MSQKVNNSQQIAKFAVERKNNKNKPTTYGRLYDDRAHTYERVNVCALRTCLAHLHCVCER